MVKKELAKLEKFLLKHGYELEEEYEDFGSKFKDYSAIGIGVHISTEAEEQ